VIVDVVEQLGTEFVIHGTSVAGTHVNVVDEGVGDAAPDDELSVGFDAADAFVFDEHGETICHGDELVAARSSSPAQ
jgi:multiple sugar transport system ATP-binding protein